MMNLHRRQRGFTLVELTVVAAVAAILASLALPGLMEQVRKARRAEAFAMLAAAQMAQERWRSRASQFASDLSATGAGATVSALYELTVDAADARGYAITASARAGTTQAADGRCARLRVRVDGGFVFHGSAATGSSSFDESLSNRCWGR